VITSRKCGLPVGAFRLLTGRSVEIYDCHLLDSYELDLGSTVYVDVWEGWRRFVSSAIDGDVRETIARMSGEELVAHYQAKVQ